MFCFNRKVLTGLAVVALGVLVLAPGAFGRVLPLLVFAACPLSMVLMMRGMSRGQHQQCATGQRTEDTEAAARTDEEIIRLRAEVDRLRAERVAFGNGHATGEQTEPDHPAPLA